MDYFKILPSKITLDILTRVPTESVIDCKSVCKAWNHLVCHHPSFSKLHFHHLNNSYADSGKLGFIAFSYDGSFHYFNYNENCESTTPIERIKRFSFTPPFKEGRSLGSSNGLICVSRGQEFFYICNPITKEYVILPEIKTDCDRSQDWTTGFGYIYSSNEYKVIVMYLSSWKQCPETHIYTLGSGDGWRILGKLNHEFNTYFWPQRVFANGALYWKDNSKEMIVGFDLADEKFCRSLSPPPLPPDVDWEDDGHTIGVLNGNLFFGVSVLVEGVELYDIWLLANKNESHDEREKHQSLGWIKAFRIDDCGNTELALLKSGCILTYGYRGELHSYFLSIYDPKASTEKPLVEFKERIYQVFPHRNTLASLKELGEEEAKVMESFETEEKSFEYHL